MTKTILTINAILVVLLAIAAFILSYHSLRDITYAHPGVDENWRWLWPLLLDVGLIAFALAIVGYRLHGENTRYAWALVIVYTVATVIFNILSIGEWSIIGAIIAASKPMTLFFAFHLLMQMLERFALRHEALSTLAALKQAINEKTGLSKTLEAQLDDLAGKISSKQRELAEIQNDLTSARWMVVNDETLNQARQILSERSDITGTDLGRLLGRSASFGRRVKRTIENELQPELINLNGRG